VDEAEASSNALQHTGGNKTRAAELLGIGLDAATSSTG
jgi:DNA-binding protein Fis